MVARLIVDQIELDRYQQSGPWKRGRVDYYTGLENRRTLTGSVGSNPTASAKLKGCYTL